MGDSLEEMHPLFEGEPKENRHHVGLRSGGTEACPRGTVSITTDSLNRSLSPCVDIFRLIAEEVAEIDDKVEGA